MLDHAVMAGADQALDKVPGGIRGHLIFRLVAGSPNALKHLQNRGLIRKGENLVGGRDNFQFISPY
jgi:hypothetical protein